MMRGRTKRGLPIRSTTGMRAIEQKEAWILVADRSQIRLLERVEGDLGRSIELRKELKNPEGRSKGSELVSDRPGRSFDSHDMSHHGQTAGPRHAYGSAADPESRVSDKWVKQAVELVREESGDKVFHLVVVAEPRLMGRLRPEIERGLPQAEVTFAEKDYAWVTTPELKRRLNDFLP